MEESSDEKSTDQHGVTATMAAQLEDRSCFILTQDCTVRRWLIQLVRWPWFERFSMFVIFINCVSLAMYNPFDRQCETLRCRVLHNIEIAVFVFFFMEMVIKMVAMGVVGKKGYLQETWNRFDCFIVMIGLIERIVQAGDSLTVIRAFRVLRPLRAINKVPSIRILVTLLLDTLPMLGNVLILSFLVFFVFGVLGVQLWQGKLRNRCFTEFPDNSSFFSCYPKYFKPRDERSDFICSLPKDKGLALCSSFPNSSLDYLWKCNGSSATNSSISRYYNTCQEEGPNPFYDTISFDNIGIAWIVIFQVITLEGWSDIMYFVQDSHGFWNWIYFVILIVTGSFFLVNLCLVVITMQFQETKAREMELMENNRRHQRADKRAKKSITSCFRYLTNKLRGNNCKEHVHHHFHHIHHHHHFHHHHLFGCFAPPSPAPSVSKGQTQTFFGDNLPTIKVQDVDEESLYFCHESDGSPRMLDSSFGFSESDVSPKRISRRNSDCSVCSHTVSVHAETVTTLPMIRIEGVQENSLSELSEGNTSFPNATRRPSECSVCSHTIIKADISHESGRQQFSGPGDSLALGLRSRKNSNSSVCTLSVHAEASTASLQVPCNPSEVIGLSSMNRSEPNVITSLGVTSSQAQEQGCGSCKSSERWKQTSAQTSRKYSMPENPQVSRDAVFLRSSNLTNEVKIKVDPAEGICFYDANDHAACSSSLKADLQCRGKENEKGDEMTSTSMPVTTATESTLKRAKFSDDARSEDDAYEFFDMHHSDSYDFLRERGPWSRLRGICLRISDSKWFAYFIMAVILVNMICMCVEHYKQPQFLTDTLEITNLVFVSIFALEMLIKLLGMGMTGYLSRGQNVFDGLIVIVSVTEIVVRSSNVSLSVFRSIRLLRIFKLVRPVRMQVLVILRTMTSVVTFLGLLFLFMFTFAILGMNLFGDKFKFKDAQGNLITVRSNFDTFLWAMVTVFQILTQENWNLIMYDGMRATNKWASLYFIALMTIGYYMLFNLLVAILVEGFTNSRFQNKSKRKKSSLKLPGQRKRQRPLSPTTRPRCDQTPATCADLRCGQPTEYCSRGLRNAFGRDFQMPSTYSPAQLHTTSGPRLDCPLSESNDKLEESLTMPQLKRMRQTSISIIRRTRMNEEPRTQVNAQPSTRMNGELSIWMNGDLCSQMNGEPSTRMNADPSTRMNREPSTRMNDESSDDSSSAVYNSAYEANEDEKEENHNASGSSTDNNKTVKTSCVGGGRNWSLGIFKPKNKFRRLMRRVTEHKFFDYVVLVFILMSCVVLAMEEPNIPAGSTKRRTMDSMMLTFAVIFTIEMAMKVIAMGLILGPGTYLRDGWNVLDGCLVFISWLDVIITNFTSSDADVLGTLRVFRALRTLRPLRMIRRAPGLKLVVQTLLFSLKPIGNTVLIAAIFFLIFGILGVQLFKGKFFYCEGGRHLFNKTQCESVHWVNEKYNFDDLAQALITLFVFSTRDGWVEIMQNGIDAVGVDQKPIVNFAEWRLVYFIPFLLLGGFLVLNMIVGVVVENFQRCRERLEEEEKTIKARRRQERAKKKREQETEQLYYNNYGPTRRWIHHVCTHLYWDVTIAVVICLNVICMSMEHYKMHKTFTSFVESANHIFTAIFVFEVILKVIALGCKRYVKDRWNIVDFIIVVLAVVGILVDALGKNLNLINPTAVRALRVLRIVRVLKLVKLAKGVRSLLDTLFEALPQVANLGLLFVLLFFIYSCLGIQLFGTIKCEPDSCHGLGRHAHFHDFKTAMLTLFRIATGDNWNGILKDTLREDCTTAECVIAPLFFVSFVLEAQFVLVNVLIAVLMKHLKESKEKIAANVAAKNLEKKLKLLTSTAKKFIRGKARKCDQPINRRRSLVELGIGGIELTQLKNCGTLDKGFYKDVLRSGAIFQEFLNLNASLEKVKLGRTSSYNFDRTSSAAVNSAHTRRRRHSLGGTRELWENSSEGNCVKPKPRIYFSGAKL